MIDSYKFQTERKKKLNGWTNGEGIIKINMDREWDNNNKWGMQ